MSSANNELFAQFFIRIYIEIPNCILACFSKLKYITGNNFKSFREIFKTKFLKGFVVPADTFDNVKGDFPISFIIWNTNIKEKFDNISLNIFDENENELGKKTFFTYDNNIKNIGKWIAQYKEKSTELSIGMINTGRIDFQNQKLVYIKNDISDVAHSAMITKNNLIPICVFFAIRLCIKADWLNDRDVFLYPKNSWEDDTEFQNDCAAFTLFHPQNRISSEQGVNHWIPFTENELNAKDSFASHFMTDFLSGKIKKTISGNDSLFSSGTKSSYPLKFSSEANAVFEAGLSLWKYYHSFDLINVNASYYDIRAFFQKFNDKGRMNPTSKDETYNSLLACLKSKMDILAQKIAVKVYEHGFLKE